MRLRQLFPLFFVALLGHASVAAEQSASQSILLASTTSVENSGLLAHILPDFTKETGIEVHVLAQGTGQALQTAARDDADLVLVHDPEAEDRFIAQGHGIERAQIAWNDFVVVGPHLTRRSSRAAMMLSRGFAQSQPPALPSCRAAIKAAPTPLRNACGVRQGSTPPHRVPVRGIGISAAVWVLRSTPLPEWTPTRSATGVRGLVSAIRARSLF
jgi:hypothetical protein